MENYSQEQAQLLQGRVALVTGSVGDGIGRSAALALAQAGADVALNFGTGRAGEDVRRTGERVQAAIQEMGRRSVLVCADTRSEQQVAALFQRIRDELGDVDILVNNAGGTWLEQDFTEISSERWEATIDAELNGAFYCMREALPAMREHRWGRIINIIVDLNSLDLLINSQYGHNLDRYPYAFAAGKVARQWLARTLAYAELKYGITINNILAGIIEHMTFEEAISEAACKASSRIGARPADVAQVIRFLCQQEARFVTNSDIVIPGNLYSRLS